MQQPPEVNGIMYEIPCTKSDLQLIIDGFIPTGEQLAIDTFYIVATWNQSHPTTPINGDTADYLIR